MPAAITDNKFASFREAAWHKLGTVFAETITDFRKMLATAGMDNLNIETVPAVLDGARFSTPTFHVVWHKADEDVVLGTVGKNYRIIPNEVSFAFLQSLQDGARWETAGLINDGRVAFGSIAFDRDIVLDPNGVADVVKSYLLLRTSFDGCGSLTAGLTPVRVVCANTLNWAMKGLSDTIKIRHTSSASARMDEAAALWRSAHTYFDAFEAEAAALLGTKVTTNQFVSLAKSLFGEPKDGSKAAATKAATRLEKNMAAWKAPANAGIAGTAWGALNALTEANQWGRGVRDGAKGTEAFAAAGAGFDAATNTFRQRAHDAVLALV